MIRTPPEKVASGFWPVCGLAKPGRSLGLAPVAVPNLACSLNRPQPRRMAWYVRFRFDGAGHIDRHPTREAAMEAACRLIKGKCEVVAIGAVPREIGPLKKDEIDRMYAEWSKQHP